MKVCFVFLISICFIGCHNSDINDKNKRNHEWAWWVDGVTGKGEWIRVADQTTVMKGRYTLFYFNGNIRETGRIDKGEYVDTCFIYDLNGKLMRYLLPPYKYPYFINDGNVILYKPDGIIFAQGIIKNHTYGDKWVQFYDNGNQEFINDFVNDTGYAVHYYRSGQLRDSLYCTKNNRNLTLKAWYENGQVKESHEIKNGMYNGICKMYYESGQLKDSGIMQNGKWEGTSFSWHDNSQLKALINNRGGKLHGLNISFHKNGDTAAIAFPVYGVLQGEARQYDEDGILIAHDYYDNNIIIKSLLKKDD